MKYNCIRNSDSPEVMRARVKHGIAAYGIYVALMQLLEEDEDHKLSKDYSMIAYEMRVDVSVVQSVVEDLIYSRLRKNISILRNFQTLSSRQEKSAKLELEPVVQVVQQRLEIS